MCISDLHNYYLDPPEIIEKRMKLYKSIGIKTMRIEMGWRNMEAEKGIWKAPIFNDYLIKARNAGMRLKLIPGTIMCPPNWFFKEHPDSQMINNDGRKSINVISFWYPGLRKYLIQSIEGIMTWLRDNNFLEITDAVFGDFSAGGEPIYPAAWTQGKPPMDEEAFWCYDKYAQKDFAQKMKEKYQTISAANQSWGRGYASFDEVTVPLPKTAPGQMWRDVLDWYRKTKNDFVIDQIKMFKAAIDKYSAGRIRLILYVPGVDITEAYYEDAVATGGGNAFIRVMSDSKFLIETAAKEGCCLQYTGVENDPEVKHLTEYIAEKGYNILLIGENAGLPQVMADPENIADIVMKYNLDGIDYTHSVLLFEDDHITPTEVFDKYIMAMDSFGKYMQKKQ